jgi:3-deoxy-D-manno-octulosonic-acid transferase
VRGTLRFAYNALGAIAEGAADVAPGGGGKLRRAFAARRGIVERFEAWGSRSRDAARPLVWFHAPSVGEGLQALPVIQLLRQRRPEAQIVYTHFSPSAERFARAAGADFTDFLPFDRASTASRVMDAIRPSVLAFSKLDVWPMLVEAAASRGIPVLMLSATLPESSARRRGVARAALGNAYASLSAVGAIDDSDAARLVELGVPAGRISVTGDTRYDQVWARARQGSRRVEVTEMAGDSRPTLVAGSTWPSDEVRLFPAWRALRASGTAWRLIIAPHEPTADHTRNIEQWAARERIRFARLGSPDRFSAEVVIVDSVGVLGDLYALATVAYVGGGFHGAGLHSVLEPAAFGVPVLFGPRRANSRDSELLVRAGGGVPVLNEADLQAMLDRWMADPAKRDAAGDAALKVVMGGLGAAGRSYELLDRSLPHGRVQEEPLHEVHAE